MTVTGAIPEISIFAMCAAVGATVFAFLCVVLHLWSSEPDEVGDEEKLYLIHERMSHIADPDTSAGRRAA